MELAVSLGGAITYVEQPATMTHAVVPEADRLARGITPGLIRMSVGLEGPEILMEHLDRGQTLVSTAGAVPHGIVPDTTLRVAAGMVSEQ